MRATSRAKRSLRSSSSRTTRSSWRTRSASAATWIWSAICAAMIVSRGIPHLHGPQVGAWGGGVSPTPLSRTQNDGVGAPSRCARSLAKRLNPGVRSSEAPIRVSWQQLHRSFSWHSRQMPWTKTACEWSRPYFSSGAHDPSSCRTLQQTLHSGTKPRSWGLGSSSPGRLSFPSGPCMRVTDPRVGRQPRPGVRRPSPRCRRRLSERRAPVAHLSFLS